MGNLLDNLIDPEKVHSKKKGREIAAECIELLKSYSAELNELARETFWQTILKDAAIQGFHETYGPERLKVKPPEKERVFTERDALWFEMLEIPYGKHSGEKVGVIYENHPAYLHALASMDEDTFKPMLNKYLLYMQRRNNLLAFPDQLSTGNKTQSCHSSSIIPTST